jgi:hypothetical protein
MTMNAEEMLHALYSVWNIEPILNNAEMTSYEKFAEIFYKMGSLSVMHAEACKRGNMDGFARQQYAIIQQIIKNFIAIDPSILEDASAPIEDGP